MWITAMDTTEEQTPPRAPSGPEQGVAPRPGPDMGAKRDLLYPEQTEEEAPVKPMPDMDPDGQDPDENETPN
jgi:hypothetical protein